MWVGPKLQAAPAPPSEVACMEQLAMRPTPGQRCAGCPQVDARTTHDNPVGKAFAALSTEHCESNHGWPTAVPFFTKTQQQQIHHHTVDIIKQTKILLGPPPANHASAI